MTLNAKRVLIASLSIIFLLSLVGVQWMEVARKHEEAGLREAPVVVDSVSKACVDCHNQANPGIVTHWTSSSHAKKGVGCVECHQAGAKDADGYEHYGVHIATVVTPRDCGRCHTAVAAEFGASHHARAGNILASLDNFLAETVEGNRVPFNPHDKAPVLTPAGAKAQVNGLASAMVGCKQCHGSKVALRSTDGSMITVDQLRPDANGIPTNADAVGKVMKDQNGRPLYDASTWPNTGIGRINLDGSSGSCSACHSRHDFSNRRARRPENCGKCHLGPDHPQKEIYEESKHGIAYRDLKEEMNLDSESWVLGVDYAQAPTCATCHMSGHSRNGGKISHDPGKRISWTNRPPISLMMDTDADHKVIKETDPEKRKAMVADSAEAKRQRMKDVCGHCHTPDYVNSFYSQYDDFVVLYNEKFGRPGKAIIAALRKNKLLTKTQFDEEVEWTWFFLWHHEGRRARHGASMMAPDYAHWHGMYEVAERFYMELVPQVQEIIHHAELEGKIAEAHAAKAVLDEILARPEHVWRAQQ